MQKSFWRFTHMNGTEPKFLNNENISPYYYQQPNPYENPPSCNINLLELSRYAKKVGKKLIELTKEEIQQFAI